MPRNLLQDLLLESITLSTESKVLICVCGNKSDVHIRFMTLFHQFLKAKIDLSQFYLTDQNKFQNQIRKK